MGLIDQTADGRKPLFRKWYTAKKKAGMPECEIFDSVVEIRLSGTEEWILIECTECVGMISAESKAGKVLWQTLQSFSGKLKGLKLVHCKGKIGFDLEPDDSIIVDWEWDEGKLKHVEEGSASSVFAQKLTLESMKAPDVLTENGLKVGANSTKRGKKGDTA